MAKLSPAQRELQRARLDFLADVGRSPAVSARSKAFRRAEKLEQAAWLAGGVKPTRLSRRGDALFKAIGRRYRLADAKPSRARNPKRGAKGQRAARQRRHRDNITAALMRRYRAASLGKRHSAVVKAHARTRSRTRASAKARLGLLERAIARLQRVGAAFPRTAGAVRRARRLRALEKARDRRARINPRKGPRPMARLARNRKGQFLPRGGGKRRRRRATRGHVRRRRRSPSRALARRAVVVVNPRRRRRRHHHAALAPRRHHRRRVRNPSMGGIVRVAKGTVMPMGFGLAAGGVAGFADTKFLSGKPIASVLTKLGLAVAGAALLGRRHPTWAMGWAGGMMGSTGYSFGVKMAGGLVATSPQSALKGIADMAAEDPDMAAQIAGLAGLGDVVEDANGLGDAAEDYNDQLGDVVTDDMADMVED